MTGPPQSAEPIVQPFLLDEFTGGGSLASHTPDIGGPWVGNNAYGGAVDLDGVGGIYSTSSFSSLYVNTVTPPGTLPGYRVEAELQVYSLLGRAGLVMGGNTTDTLNYYAYYNADSQQWAIGLNGIDLVSVSASVANAAYPPTPIPTPGVANRIMFWSDGGWMGLVVDDVLTLTVNNTSVGLGYAGVFFQGQTDVSTGVHLANLAAKPLLPNVPVDLADLSLALMRMPVDMGVVGVNLMSLTIDPDNTFPLAGFPYVMLQVGTGNGMVGEVLGAGRYLSGMSQRFSFHVVSQSAQDIAYDDTVRLTQSTVGTLRVAQKIINVMQLTFTKDVWGNNITQEPIRVSSEMKPRRYGPGPKNNVYWSGLQIDFEVEYSGKMTLNQPLT